MTVIEHVKLGFPDQVATITVLTKSKRSTAVDDSFRGNAVDLLGDRPHEIPAATRSDVIGESIGFKVLQRFRHRFVALLEVNSLVILASR